MTVGVYRELDTHRQKNNGLVSKDYITALKLFPVLCCCADGEDGNGLKLENVCQFFQVVTLCVEKKGQKIFWISLPGKIHLISSS